VQSKRRSKSVIRATQPAASPTQAGWRVGQWSQDVGCSQSTTWELIAARRIESVKLHSSRVIVISPKAFLASLRDSIERDDVDAASTEMTSMPEREGIATAHPHDHPVGDGRSTKRPAPRLEAGMTVTPFRPDDSIAVLPSDVEAERVTPFALRHGEKELPRYSCIPSAAVLAKLHAETYRLLMVFGFFVSYADGHCYPSRGLLAELSGIAQRNLNRNLRDLVKAGLLRINPDGTYTLIFEHPGQHGTEPQKHRTEPKHHRSVSRARREQPIEQPREHTHGLPVPFDRFWRVYPSRGSGSNPRKPAESKFAELVQRGVDPEMLISAAVRYAKATADVEPRYVVQAVRWLTEERFNDGGYSAEVEAVVIKVSSQPGPSDDEWEEMVSTFAARGARSADWPTKKYGLPPQHRASRVPPAIRKKYGFDD
jgi:hypothetical protein